MPEKNLWAVVRAVFNNAKRAEAEGIQIRARFEEQSFLLEFLYDGKREKDRFFLGLSRETGQTSYDDIIEFMRRQGGFVQWTDLKEKGIQVRLAFEPEQKAFKN